MCIRDRFKAVQMGGPSGGCIPKELLDTVIDYKALSATGAIMGSGGMVVMDESTCMVGMAKFFLDFTTKESCGKCVHCRLGTKRMLGILTRIVNGEGKEGDSELLEELCYAVKDGALCGLGQTCLLYTSLQKLSVKSVQRRGSGLSLHHYINAVSVVFYHSFYSPNLPFYSV